MGSTSGEHQLYNKSKRVMNMDLLIWLATDSKWIQCAKLNPVHLFLDFWTWTDRCVALKWKGVLKGQYKWIYECNLTGIFHRILHPSLRPSERKIEGKKDDRKWRKRLRWHLGSTCQAQAVFVFWGNVNGSFSDLCWWNHNATDVCV